MSCTTGSPCCPHYLCGHSHPSLDELQASQTLSPSLPNEFGFLDQDPFDHRGSVGSASDCPWKNPNVTSSAKTTTSKSSLTLDVPRWSVPRQRILFPGLRLIFPYLSQWMGLPGALLPDKKEWFVTRFSTTRETSPSSPVRDITCPLCVFVC